HPAPPAFPTRRSSDLDVDRRGVYAAPAPLFWRFAKPPTHVDGPLPEQFSWELERFCELALAANPTVLECLWSPLVEKVTPAGEEDRKSTRLNSSHVKI